MRVAVLGIALLLSITALAVHIDGADADEPASLYFFDDGECIAQIYLLPGEPLDGSDIPWHGSYKEWYDDQGERVYGGRTFTAGEHIIKTYDIDHPPSKKSPPSTETSTEIPWGVIATVMSSAALIGVAYIIVRK